MKRIVARLRPMSKIKACCVKKAVAEAPKRFALSKALELNDGDVGQLRLLSD